MAVDTDTLINQAIEAKAALQSQRDNLEVERRSLVQQLGGIRNRAQAAQIKARISGLDATEKNLNTQQHSQDAEANLRVNSAFRNAHIAKQALDNQNHEQTATQAANLMNGIASLQAKYPNRVYDGNQADKFHTEIEQLTNDNRMGMHSQSAAAAVRAATTFFDNERAKTLNTSAQKLAGFGLTPQQFASRDSAKDFRTNADSLADANSPDKATNKRAEDGKNTVLTVDGKPYIIPSISFNHYDANFKKQPQAESAPVAGQVNVPADQPPKGTNYTFSGTQTPNHPGDYWSEPQANGLVTHHFAGGGSATVADHATPEGQELINNARQQTADRKQFIEQNPSVATVAGGATLSRENTDSGISVNFPANLSQTGVSVPQIDVVHDRNDNRTATLPTGVQPNAPTVPAQQLAVQPASQQAAPVAQPSATPAAPQVAQIASQADYDALAPGATFIHNGQQFQKPKPQESQ